MINLTVDTKKNLLVLECEGYISVEEALETSAVFNEEIKKLKRGIVVISNISNLTSSCRQVRIILQTAMRKVDLLYPKKIIRIVKNNSGALFFERAEVLAKTNYDVFKVKTPEEATSLINKII